MKFIVRKKMIEKYTSKYKQHSDSCSDSYINMYINIRNVKSCVKLTFSLVLQNISLASITWSIIIRKSFFFHWFDRGWLYDLYIENHMENHVENTI